MKRIIVVAAAFFLLMAGVSAHAQTESQDSTVQEHKLNKKNLVIKEWNTDAKSTKRVLDHVTTYNQDGKKIEEIEYNSSGQKWRKRFEWGENGRLARELIYDEKNRLVTYKTFDYNEFGRKKTQYTYSAKNKLLSIKIFEYLAEDAG